MGKGEEFSVFVSGFDFLAIIAGYFVYIFKNLPYKNIGNSCLYFFFNKSSRGLLMLHSPFFSEKNSLEKVFKIWFWYNMPDDSI